MNLVDRVNRERSLTAISRTRRFGRIAANASEPTTTYSYDANGNLTQAGGWSYMWDYLNRMLASGYNNSTTTYAYDPSGARVLQTSTTSTTYYPNKYYSLTSTKAGSNTYATSTNYIWNGNTLLATIDQKLYNGAATGSPITRYIHPDHLGSTNAVTDQNGALVQLMDYYPYGATRIATSTYPTNEKRQYIGQFSDAPTNLNYLNARYYDGNRGQFLSEDPVFWSPQNLNDPQSLNAYSYAQNNPIVGKDPSGRCPLCLIPVAMFVGGVGGATRVFVSDMISNYDMHGTDVQSYEFSSRQDYLYNAGTGMALGAVVASAGLLEVPAMGIGAITAVGTGAADAGQDAWIDKQPINWYADGFDAGISGLTAGFIEGTPKIRGRTPKLLTKAFFSGAHTQNEILGGAVDTAAGGFALGNYKAGMGIAYSSAAGGNGPVATSNTKTGTSGGASLSPSSSGGGYGSPGTVYTQFMPANSHSACGTLCR